MRAELNEPRARPGVLLKLISPLSGAVLHEVPGVQLHWSFSELEEKLLQWLLMAPHQNILFCEEDGSRIPVFRTVQTVVSGIRRFMVPRFQPY